MKFLREKNSDIYRLASMQARIFVKSYTDNIASYFFIQGFMNSDDAKQLDDLSFLLSGSSELEIFTHVKNSLKKTKGYFYPKERLHWMGFFYRYAAYLTGFTSKELFKKISPKYLSQVYPFYHSLDIVKAIETVFSDLHIKQNDPNERFINLYKKKLISL